MTTITLMGENVPIDVNQGNFYETMLEAIVDRVFQLLGPEFDKKAYLDEVEGGRLNVEMGRELSIPVSMLLSMEVGYCLGQLKVLGRPLDADRALEDLYRIWKARLKEMLRRETRGYMH